MYIYLISTTGIQPATPEVTYTYTPTGAVDKIIYEGGKQADYGYNIRDWVTSINSVDSPAGSFAASYSYQKNGNIAMSRFYNPDIELTGHNDYRYLYEYDNLNRLTGADYRYGSSATESTSFDVNGLSYDATGNILSLQRRDEVGAMVDNLSYTYSGNRLVQLDDAITNVTETLVYEDALIAPWIDTSWSAIIDYTSSEQVFEGTTSVKVIQDGWGSLSLRSGSWDEPVDISPADYHTFEFEIYAPSGVSMDLFVNNDNGDSFERVIWGSVPAGQWTTLSFDFDEFNPGGHVVHRFNIREISGVDSVVYYVDNIRLLGADTTDVNPVGWDAFSSSFTYDPNGNMKSQSGKFTDIAYEHRNLPVHFHLDSGAELIANYNAEGQRILKESSGGAWSFYVTNGLQTLAVIDQDGLSHMNLFGTDQFGRIEASSGAISTANTRRYYLKDHLGSTRMVVGNDGLLKEAHDFYPFGLTMPGRSKGEALTHEQFTGQLRDNEPGFNLDYFKARYYDPAIGRFLSVDPILNEKSTSDLFELHNGRLIGESPYSYAFNSPLSFVDPDGKVPFLIPAIPFVIKGATVTYAAVKATVITAAVAAGAYTVHNVTQNVEFDNLVEIWPPNQSQLEAGTLQGDPGNPFNDSMKRQSQGDRFNNFHNMGGNNGNLWKIIGGVGIGTATAAFLNQITSDISDSSERQLEAQRQEDRELERETQRILDCRQNEGSDC